jgi:hypothetical protein
LGTQPAGAFVVETNEELLEGISFPVWRRQSTVIRLHPHPGLGLTVTIDPAELDAALLKDSASVERRLESPLRTRVASTKVHRNNKKAFFHRARGR